VCRLGRNGIEALRAARKTSAMASASLGSAGRSERAAMRRNLKTVAARKRDEPVRLTRIYTRGGDRGETSLGDGSRVSKLDPRIGAYGTVDEVNAQIGLVLAADVPADARSVLERVQNELFDVGADLAVPYEVEGRLRVTDDRVAALERECDRLNADLPELKSFVLPGGSEAAARLHVARTICRRAEREVLATSHEVEINPRVIVYLNRLSDLLFILARAANAASGHDEPLWKPGS
jgi:cob(I)alamin adenosyltransferase